MRRWGTFARHAVLLSAGLLFTLPLYIALIGAFKPTDQIVGSPLRPSPLSLDAIRKALDQPTFDIAAAYRTSILITVTAVALLLIVSSMIAYWIGRAPGRWPRRLELFLLLGLMVPPQVILLPVLHVLDWLGLLFTYPGLIVYDVGVYIPLAAFILSRFVAAIPPELEEAAGVDGAGPLRVFFRISLPLLRPALITLAVLLTIFIWNDFVNPLILLGSGRGETVTTGIYRSIGTYSTDYSSVFANILLVSAPMIVLYLLMQRRVIGAFAAGAVKG